MIPFPFFPLPEALFPASTVLFWAISGILLWLVALICVGMSLYLLGATGFSGEYDRGTTIAGLFYLGIATLLVIFHYWFVMVVAGGLILYWIGWRLLLKNILVAIGLIK